ncbi:hypothetical protein DW352_12380 [Pseudolabrys taiwanensis]|uniref:Uncharacterized protein n=1 Tax=Pseudolabrys taiwanensis TaxID=331696 RepID=A0A345ZWE4_9HYPH|nr:hypothetical protein [Pseudolabrys taiwanensis]AXK81241.1 hypothetical protein DW352_12380 [Pseudolabrys taiwanensis]
MNMIKRAWNKMLEFAAVMESEDDLVYSYARSLAGRIDELERKVQALEASSDRETVGVADPMVVHTP